MCFGVVLLQPPLSVRVQPGLCTMRRSSANMQRVFLHIYICIYVYIYFFIYLFFRIVRIVNLCAHVRSVVNFASKKKVTTQRYWK